MAVERQDNSEERYISALAGATQVLSSHPRTFNVNQTTESGEIVKWGRAINKAAEVALSPAYNELVSTSIDIENGSGLKYQGYNGTVYGQMIDGAYKGAAKRVASKEVKIGDLTGPKMVVPEEYKGIPAEQFAKLRFVEETTAWAMGTTVEEAKADIGLARDRIKSLVTRAKKTGNYDKLEKDYDIKIGDVDPKLFSRFVNKFLLDPRHDDVTIFCFDVNTVAEINDQIAKAKSSERKAELEKVKWALGGISQAVYLEINNRIEEDILVDIENAMRNQVNYHNGVQREHTVFLVNGDYTAGKGTVLEALNAEVVEPGTTGMFGHMGTYKPYTPVAGAYDSARGSAYLVPPNVMRMLMALEIMARRQMLDEQGRAAEALILSGYPRSEEQAKTIIGINNPISIVMTVEPETAPVRVLTRIGGELHDGIELRDDSFADIGTFSGDPVNRDQVAELVKSKLAITPLGEGGSLDKEALFAALRPEVSQAYKMKKTSRYSKYKERDLPQITQLLSDHGIQSVVIPTDEMSIPEEIRAVKKAIGLNN